MPKAQVPKAQMPKAQIPKAHMPKAIPISTPGVGDMVERRRQMIALALQEEARKGLPSLTGTSASLAPLSARGGS